MDGVVRVRGNGASSDAPLSHRESGVSRRCLPGVRARRDRRLGDLYRRPRARRALPTVPTPCRAAAEGDAASVYMHYTIGAVNKSVKTKHKLCVCAHFFGWLRQPPLKSRAQ